MNEFVTWGAMESYVTFVAFVFVIVEATKNLKFLKNFNTKHHAFWVAFVLLTIVQVHANTFNPWDIVLYAVSAVMIAMNASGISDHNFKPVNQESKAVDTNTNR